MRHVPRVRIAVTSLGVVVCGLWLLAQPPQSPAPQQGTVAAPGGERGRGQGRGGGRGPRVRKTVLAWADTRNGIAQHDSVSHALAVIERLGYESGAYDTYIRTDSNIVAKAPLRTTGEPASGGPSLANVDAIFFLGHREVPLDPQQRAELAAFVRDEGKGFVAAHVALTAFESWPEFGELLGGRYDGHPWNTVPGTIINEDPTFPATRHFGAAPFAFTDEFYQPKEYSRDKIARAAPSRRVDPAAEPGAAPHRRRLSARLGEDLRQGAGVLFLARSRRRRPGTIETCR